jgi:hypothetical protein
MFKFPKQPIAEIEESDSAQKRRENRTTRHKNRYKYFSPIRESLAQKEYRRERYFQWHGKKIKDSGQKKDKNYEIVQFYVPVPQKLPKNGFQDIKQEKKPVTPENP